MAVKVDPKKCIGCGICKDFCYYKAITIEKNIAVISDKCVECGACVPQCPKEALVIVSK